MDKKEKLAKKKERREKYEAYKKEQREKYLEYKKSHSERRKKFWTSFGNQLIKDKFFLLCTLITIVYSVVLVYNKFTNEIDKVKIGNKITDNTVEPAIKENKELTNDDIKNYVGTYSRTIKLNNDIQVNSCKMTSYKLIYIIEEDKKITKYFDSDCIGTIEIYNEKLEYYSTGGATYIGNGLNNFIFGTSSIKEVDGETYSKEKINVREKQIDKNIEIDFYANDIIILTNDNLFLLKESSISYESSEQYQSIGGNLNKRFYKDDSEYTYNFIVFNSEDKISCYDNETSEDTIYTIYQIKYNKETKSFETPKQILKRAKSSGCETYKEDLKTLQG